MHWLFFLQTHPSVLKIFGLAASVLTTPSSDLKSVKLLRKVRNKKHLGGIFPSKQLPKSLDTVKHIETLGIHDLLSIRKCFHLLFLTVPGGVETRYSCCENAVGSPGCQVFKVRYLWSQTLHPSASCVCNALYAMVRIIKSRPLYPINQMVCFFSFCFFLST